MSPSEQPEGTGAQRRLRAPKEHRARVAAVCWVAIAFVAWNLLYDQIVGRAIKEYLLRHAMWEAGRGPLVSIADVLDPAIYDAVWKSTLFASILLLAGLLTIRYIGRP